VKNIEQSEPAVIVQIGSPVESKLYVLAEASELLPVVRKITENAYERLSRLDERLDLMLLCDPRRTAIADEYEKIVRKWIASITRLGAIPNGLWRVDFDTGEGYLCWRFPELRIGLLATNRCIFTSGLVAVPPASPLSHKFLTHRIALAWTFH